MAAEWRKGMMSVQYLTMGWEKIQTSEKNLKGKNPLCQKNTRQQNRIRYFIF